jgi:hypothetical protein
VRSTICAGRELFTRCPGARAAVKRGDLVHAGAITHHVGDAADLPIDGAIEKIG